LATATLIASTVEVVASMIAAMTQACARAWSLTVAPPPEYDGTDQWENVSPIVMGFVLSFAETQPSNHN
jgi:hypothetical protein